MLPDDPRHGSRAGYYAHLRAKQKSCEPCRTAARHYEIRRLVDQLAGRPRSLSHVGTQRRIRGLVWLGYSYPDLAERLGVTPCQISNLANRDRTHARIDTARAVASLFDELAMTTPVPTDKAHQRRISYARTVARKHGWLPPLAWDDIDDPGEQPAKVIRRDWHSTSRADVDEVVVDRLLHLRPVESPTQAEKHEAMRRWLDRGKSEKALCAAHGWREGRYVTKRQEDAA